MRHVGEITEGAVLAKCLKLGLTVLQPFGYAHRYDYVIDTGAALVKIQCKTARLVKGSLMFNACSTDNVTQKRKDYRGEVDFFAVYDPVEDKVYLVRPEVVGKATGSLKLAKPVVPNKRVRMASDYEIEKVLAGL